MDLQDLLYSQLSLTDESFVSVREPVGRKNKPGTGEMVQQLRALTALAEDLNLDLRTPTWWKTVISIPRECDALWPPWVSALM